MSTSGKDDECGIYAICDAFGAYYPYPEQPTHRELLKIATTGEVASYMVAVQNDQRPDADILPIDRDNFTASHLAGTICRMGLQAGSQPSTRRLH